MALLTKKVRFDSAARAEVYCQLAELTRTHSLPEAIGCLRRRYEATGDYRADILRQWEAGNDPLFQRVKGWAPPSERAILSEADSHAANAGPALEEAATMARVSGDIRREMVLGSFVPLALLGMCAVALCVWS